MADDEVEDAIRYYFSKNFDYNTILSFLEKDHKIIISQRTLLHRLQKYGLHRRNRIVDKDVVRGHVRQELDGAGSLLGYRSMWKRLNAKYGINVPRATVQSILKELDPEGSEQRKAHRLKRRQYINPGPNYCWHCDGYDKLKPYGFPIHGSIDGFSRRIMWLKVTRTNNNPHVVASFYVESIKNLNGCPTLVRTDRGTENGVTATIQCFLRRNHHDSLAGMKAHRYGSSHSNQRIEGWWAFLRKSWSSWWMNFFKDMVYKGELDTSDPMHTEYLWFSFNKIIQRELDEMKDEWNNHYIRTSKNHTPSGIPESLYFLPSNVDAIDHLQFYDTADLQEAENEIESSDVNEIIDDDSREYLAYFDYVIDFLGMEEPNNWRKALNVYHKLLESAT